MCAGYAARVYRVHHAVQVRVAMVMGYGMKTLVLIFFIHDLFSAQNYTDKYKSKKSFHFGSACSCLNLF